jgi:hypothetical protein
MTKHYFSLHVFHSTEILFGTVRDLTRPLLLYSNFITNELLQQRCYLPQQASYVQNNYFQKSEQIMLYFKTSTAFRKVLSVRR